MHAVIRRLARIPRSTSYNNRFVWGEGAGHRFCVAFVILRSEMWIFTSAKRKWSCQPSPAIFIIRKQH